MFLNFHVSNSSLPDLFFQTYSWIHLVFDFQLITLHHVYQKTRVFVFCFLSCLLSFHLSFVWNYSYYTSTELLARYKCMPISLFTPNFLPNVFRKQYVLLVYRSLLTCPPPPLVLCVQSRQHNHAFYQLIIFSLANSAPVKHLIIYAGGIYRDPPHPDFCLLSLFVWKFLAFSFNYMHVCSFWVEGKKKKR